LVTNNVEVLNSDFKILSGSAGTGGGTSYVPLKNSVFDFMFSSQFQVSATAITATVVQGTLSATNNYVAMPFILAESLRINRLIMRVSTIATPVMQVQAGIMNFDTTTGYPTQNATSTVQFVSSQTVGTATSFTNGTYTEFSFATTTLSANTWYCYGAAISTYTSGNIVFNTQLSNSWLSSSAWPSIRVRTATGANSSITSQMTAAIGYNDGTSAVFYIGDLTDGSSNISILPTVSGNTQVGFKLELNLPVDEIAINKIALHQSAINTSHTMVCKIYDSIFGTKAIGTSFFINTSYVVAVAPSLKTRYYYFNPPVRIKPYTTYYPMFEVAQGAFTATNPSYVGRLNIENQYFYSYDSTNHLYYRAAAADATFTHSSSFIAPVSVYFTDVRNTPRPQTM
jgi:hypothetical protein